MLNINDNIGVKEVVYKLDVSDLVIRLCSLSVVLKEVDIWIVEILKGGLDERFVVEFVMMRFSIFFVEIELFKKKIVLRKSLGIRGRKKNFIS